MVYHAEFPRGGVYQAEVDQRANDGVSAFVRGTPACVDSNKRINASKSTCYEVDPDQTLLDLLGSHKGGLAWIMGCIQKRLMRDSGRVDGSRDMPPKCFFGRRARGLELIEWS